jgi:two-component system CheB/CheR fusion protein
MNNGGNEHYIVAIGASAGGLEAIHDFFDNMPQHNNISFVVIQHLSPDYKSLLVELIGKHTHMKVYEASNNMSVDKECVYIIPNNKLMTINNGRLRLDAKSNDKQPNTAIDTFLHSLAEDQKEKAIAIILSGTGTDGTRGIASVKEKGGVVIVQDPLSAKFDGMPNSAITSGNADFILPPEMMPEEIFASIKEIPVHTLNKGKIDETQISDIFQMVQQVSGYDFQLYKTPTIIRRIGRRMMHGNFKNVQDYIAHLKETPAEVKALSEDFLINVTKFFRDEAAFELLAEQVIPAIVKSKKDGDILKVWIAACSTGEEAYSIAILIDDHLHKRNRQLEVKIFATDLDEKSIAVASANQYPSSVENDVPRDLFEKYFVREGNNYALIPRIRKQIVFAKHNIIKDPPFIKNDLVSCRNMLIYMNGLLQKKVLATFHFSLEHNGYLFLGSSETAAFIKESVEEISSKWKIYKKISSARLNTIDMYRSAPVDRSAFPKAKTAFTKKEEKQETLLEKDFKNILLEELSYTAVYINPMYEIQETIGDFKKFFTLPEKKLNLNLLKMVPQELSVALNTAIRKAWKDQENVVNKNVKIKKDEDDVYVNIIVKPALPEQGRPHTVVILNEAWHELKKSSEPVSNSQVDAAQHLDYINELEFELNETRNNLQLAIESLETTNEELQSSNEELLSANEELQSSNEELQSLNEELHTLNTEHQFKIRELIELNDDMNNYFKSTDIGQLFLDTQLNIRKFNPAAVKLINLIESDLGRPVSHISNNILNENLDKELRLVLTTGKTFEKEITLANGNYSLMKIMPYIRQDKSVDGIVMTFVDVTTLNYLNNVLKGVFNSSTNGIFVFRTVRDQNNISDLQCVTFNKASEKFFETNSGGFIGKSIKHIKGLTDNGMLQKYIEVVNTGKTLSTEIRLGEGDKEVWLETVAVKMLDGLVVTFNDITSKKHAETKLQKNYYELIAAREDLQKMNVQLEDKVNERTKELTQSEERFRFVSSATNDSIWDWDLSNDSMWWNDNFFRLFGYEPTKETLSRKFWSSKLHPQDAEKITDSINKCIKTKNKQWSAEYRFKKADGSYAYVLDRGYLLRNENEMPYRMIGSMMDVTNIVQANKEIQKNEARFRFLADSIPQKVFTAFPDGNVNYYNEKWFEYTGATSELLYNSGWKQLLHPDEEEAVMNQWHDALNSGNELETEHRLKNRNDEYRWHLNRAIPLTDTDGNITLWVGTTTDIHDQKQFAEKLQESENHFRKLADQSPFMIWQVNDKGQCTYVNKTWVDFTGSSLEATIEDGWQTMVHEEDVQDEQRKFTKAQSKQVPYHSKFRLRRRDGEYRWVRAQANPVANGEGYIGSLNDITEQELAEQATKTLLQKKDEFLSIASHELKTPITSMKASLQLAERITAAEEGQAQLQTFISKANKQVNKLSGLVEDLLDVTKIHSGKIQFNKTIFVIDEAIQECLDQLQPDVTKHKITVKGKANVKVFADKHRLEQVINNFVSNAIKYSPDADEVVIEVKANKQSLRLSVTDFGIGIPKDKIPFVFDRFFRVQEQSHKFSGLGLGLFISAEIVKRHGGEIGVESGVESGSTFWFNLPLNIPQETSELLSDTNQKIASSKT